jgi:hypothetical protein
MKVVPEISFTLSYVAYITTCRCALQEEKQKIQNDLRILTERLSRINDSLARKVASRNEYDKTIMETEAAYMKILESSQVQGKILDNNTIFYEITFISTKPFGPFSATMGSVTTCTDTDSLSSCLHVILIQKCSALQIPAP